jgi:hypothetical protein
MFKRQYRIVTDNHAGFEVQKKLWYSLFWFQIKNEIGKIINTNCCIEDAEKLIEIDKIRTTPLKNKVVKIYPCD